MNLDNLRHSCAHLLAAAVMDLWPGALLTLGPSIDDGFYYDIDFGDTKISEEDFPKIESKMHEIVKSWKGFEKIDVDADRAIKEFKNNPYKVELIDEIVEKGEKITFY